MGTLDGKVAFITGAARGQGRSHAVRLAREGADIVALDICQDIASMDYPNSKASDLAETKRLVSETGRRVMARELDVRDPVAVRKTAEDAFEFFGRIDIVLPTAGILRLGPPTSIEQGDEVWDDMLATNLTGAWHVANATIPFLIKGARGGSIVFTGSTAGVRPTASLKPGKLGYTAAKWGLVGLGRSLATALAEHSIRVNVVHPTGVASGMTQNKAMDEMMAAASNGGKNAISSMQNALPVSMLQPSDISDAVAFLVSDQAKWITGVGLPVDAGFCAL